MNGKGSKRRPEDAKAVEKNWPFDPPKRCDCPPKWGCDRCIFPKK